ncbi:ABC transporter ATP-binding protein [Spirochaetota bacterium]
MLCIEEIVSGYGSLQVLKGISMHIDAGEIVAIIGANGAGKTTLLHTIAGLINIERGGGIFFEKKAIHAMSTERIIRLGCTLVPEGRQLFQEMTVFENIILGAYTQRKSMEEVNKELENIYSMFPVLKEREKQLAGTLSGGEQQMLAIGRALMSKPKLIMLDEPSMGLAPIIVKNIFKVIVNLREQGNTILLVEQNAKAALGIADRGYVLETGRVTLEGASGVLLKNKDVQHAYLGKE